MQHGQASAPHPKALRGRRDLDGRTGKHRDSIAVTHAGARQAAGHAAGTLMHLAPAMPHGGAGFTGRHPVTAAKSVAVHGVAKSAHDRPRCR